VPRTDRLLDAGVAACDPISGCPVGSPIPAPRTPHGIARDLFSTPVLTVLPVAMIALSGRFHRASDRLWTLLSATAAPGIFACFVLAAIGFNQNPALMPSRRDPAAPGVAHRAGLANPVATPIITISRIRRGTEA